MAEIDGKDSETAEKNSGTGDKMTGGTSETDGKNSGTSGKNVSPDALARSGKGEVIRDEQGRWLRPPTGGRAKRADERAIIAAMDRALPPDKLSEALQDALTWAYEYKSPKLILAIAQFVVSYQIGQPVQRSVSASGKLETILNRLSSMEDGEFDAVERAMRGDAIDIKGE